jgi:hypothetical protein
MRQVFLLSPAHCGGERAALVFNPNARFEMARKLRTKRGVAIGEVFSFLSGLYFRGKLAYARTFADPPLTIPGALTITTNRGLVPVNRRITLDHLREMGTGDIDLNDSSYRLPLERDVENLAHALGRNDRVILLGSIATGKYVDVLQGALGSRLLFPQEFIGRGDMSRGGLMLRCIDEKRELTYIPLTSDAIRRGTRPPRLGARGMRSGVKN